MNSKSFLSSSSTLAEGLDLMAAPMEDVVGKKFPLDDEEKELKLRLEAIPSLALIFFPNIPFALVPKQGDVVVRPWTRESLMPIAMLRPACCALHAAPSTAQQTQEDQDKDLHFHAVFYGCSYIRDCYG